MVFDVFKKNNNNLYIFFNEEIASAAKAMNMSCTFLVRSGVIRKRDILFLENIYWQKNQVINILVEFPRKETLYILKAIIY